MSQAFEWVKANWGLLLIVLSAAIAALSIINRSVIHFCNLTGPWYHRILPTVLFGLTELFSVLSAKDVAGTWKLPGTIKKP